MSLMLEEIAQQPEALARTIAEERAKVERLDQASNEPEKPEAKPADPKMAPAKK